MSETLIDLVAARLVDEVDAFEERVLGIMELSEGIEQMLQRTPGAYVFPLGLRPAPPLTGSMEHRQEITWRIGVVLVDQVADDPDGRRSIGSIQALIDSVLLALAGWSPDAATWSPLAAGPGDLVEAEAGTVAFQLSFTTTSELRT